MSPECGPAPVTIVPVTSTTAPASTSRRLIHCTPGDTDTTGSVGGSDA